MKAESSVLLRSNKATLASLFLVLSLLPIRLWSANAFSAAVTDVLMLPQSPMTVGDLGKIGDAVKVFKFGQNDLNPIGGRVGDPVSTKDGLVFFSATDFSYARTGPDLAFTRHYNPKIQAVNKTMGHSWISDYHTFIFQRVNGSTYEAHLVLPNQVYMFTANSVSGPWTPPAGCFYKLEAESVVPNTTVEGASVYRSLKLTSKEGEVAYYSSFSPGAENVYKPVYWQDRNGNSLTYEYDNVPIRSWYAANTSPTIESYRCDYCFQTVVGGRRVTRCIPYTCYRQTGWTIDSWRRYGSEYDTRLKRVFSNQDDDWKLEFDYTEAPTQEPIYPPDNPYYRYYDSNFEILSAVVAYSNGIAIRRIGLSYDISDGIRDLIGVQRGTVAEPTIASPASYVYSRNVASDINPVMLSKYDGFKSKLSGNNDPLELAGNRASYLYHQDAAGKFTSNVRTVFNGRGQEVCTLNSHKENEGTSAERTITEISRDGGVFRKDIYNALGLLVRQDHEVYGGATPLSYSEEFFYNANHQVVRQENGTKISYSEYDSNGNLTKFTNPSGGIVEYEYDSRDLVVRMENPLGNETHFYYDSAGNCVRQEMPLGKTLHFVRDGRGRVTEEVSAMGGITRYTYDQYGNQATTTDPLGRRTEKTFSFYSEMIYSKTPLLETTWLQYDSNGHLMSINHPDSSSERFSYDDDGNLTRYEDRKGVVRDRTYDADGNLTEELLAGERTELVYTALGKIASVTPPMGNVTLYSHDQLGRVIETTTVGINSVYLRYDRYGNVIKRMQGGVDIQYVYDDSGNLKSRTSTDGRITLLQTFDVAGNRLSMADVEGPKIYEYDELNRLVSVDNQALGVKITYEYDLNDNVVAVTDSRTGGRVEYEYDLANKVRSQTDADGDRIGFSYDDNSRVVETSYLGGEFKTLTQFDSMGQVKFVSHVNGRGEAYETHDIRRDLGSNVEEVKTLGGSELYAYDSAPSRLIQAGNQTLEYDPNGNRKSRMISISGTGTILQNYTYGQADKLLSDGVYDYTHDSRGNMTGKFLSPGVGETYQWDEVDRLVEVSSNEAGNAYSVNYVYDGNDRLVARSGLTQRRILNNAAAPWVIFDEEGEVVRRYSGRYAFKESNGSKYFVLFDGRGNGELLMDRFGNPVRHYNYDAFGQEASRKGDDFPLHKDGFFYAQRDSETGLILMWRRWYSPDLGRFISRDPIGISGGLNQYVFARNNPMLYNDAMGEEPLTVGAILAIGAVVGGVAGIVNAMSTPGATLGTIALQGLIGAATGALVPLAAVKLSLGIFGTSVVGGLASLASTITNRTIFNNNGDWARTLGEREVLAFSMISGMAGGGVGAWIGGVGSGATKGLFEATGIAFAGMIEGGLGTFLINASDIGDRNNQFFRSPRFNGD